MCCSDFLLFLPAQSPGLKHVFSYYQSAVKVTSEGEVSLSDDSVTGLGTAVSSFFRTYLFGAITQIAAPPVAAHETVPTISAMPLQEPSDPHKNDEVTEAESTSPTLQKWSVLTQYVPDPGYFLAGGLSGVASRTTTAPLDRLKVYLIAQTGDAEAGIQAAKDGAPVKAAQKGVEGLASACRKLWAAGGIRSLFAGMYKDAM